MQKLTIEINSETWDFWYSLEEIKSQIEKWFLEWYNKNEKENYFFKIN